MSYIIRHASFEFFPDLGAIEILRSGYPVFISESSFLWCNRTGNSGGAILLIASVMENRISRCCASFCWVNSRNGNYEDYGQFVYFTHQSGSSEVNETSCVYCSVDKEWTRHAPITFLRCTGSVHSINISSCICCRGSGVYLHEGKRLSAKYCCFENDVAYDRAGALGAYSGVLEASNINFIGCKNEAVYSPLMEKAVGTFSFCYFVNCTKYPYSEYGITIEKPVPFRLLDCDDILIYKNCSVRIFNYHKRRILMSLLFFPILYH